MIPTKLATVAGDPPVLTPEQIRDAMEKGAAEARAWWERTRGMHMASMWGRR